MPLSFKSRLAKLEHKGQISKEEYQDLLRKLDGHDRQIRADAIDEYMNKLCDKCSQTLNEHWKFECPFADGECEIVKIAEQLKKKRGKI